MLATGVADWEIEAAGQVTGLAGANVAKLDIRDGAAIEAAIAALPRLDHVVNCAGLFVAATSSIRTVFAEVVDINLNGTMRVCSAARPLLRERGGTIVNTASMLAFFGGGLVPG